MPSDDLILNVKQIDGYPATASAMPSDAIVLQRGGLGGPYLSISPALFVGTALAQGGGMAIGGLLMAQSVQAGSGQFSNLATGLFSAQKACVVDFAATWATVGGVPIATTDYVDNLIASVKAASVWSFMGRTGDVRLWIQDILAAGGAPNFSPVFGGEPRAPTPAARSNNSRLATTAFVQRCVIMAIDSFAAHQPLVFSFNGRTGDVALTAADVETALAGSPIEFAPIDSPAFTGYATAPTPPPGSINAQIATTAFVMNAVAESTVGVASFNGRTGVVALQAADLTGAGGALLASPVFSGTPQAPTAPLGTATGQLATTAFVLNELGGSNLGVVSFNGRDGAVTLNSTDIANAGGATTAYVNAAVAAAVVSFNGRTGAVTLTANDLSAVGGAALASPAFTGTPTAPTASPGVSTNQLATCAFVMAALAAGGGVTSFNGRAGAVTLSGADVSAAGGLLSAAAALTYLPLAGGTLTGALGGTTGSFSGQITCGGLASPSASINGLNGTIGGIALNANNLDVPGSGMFGSGVYFSSSVAPDFYTLGNATSRNVQFAAGYTWNYTTTTGELVWFGNSVGVFVLGFTGNLLINGVLTQGSDIRAKRDVLAAPEGLAEVVKLRPVHYRRIIAPDPNIRQPRLDQVELGFVAQEVQDALPLAVKQGDDGSLGVSLMPLIAALVNAVKQLDLRTAALEAA